MGRTKQTPNRLFVSASLLFLILELGTEERWVAQQVVKVLVMLVFDGPANCLAYNTLVMPVSEGCLLCFIDRCLMLLLLLAGTPLPCKHPNEKAIRWFLGPFITISIAFFPRFCVNPRRTHKHAHCIFFSLRHNN